MADNKTTTQETAASALTGAELIRGVQLGGMVKILVSQIFTYVASVVGTFTNKRITPRITSITSSATPTVNTDDCDGVVITALAAAITSFTTNLSGTPTDGQRLIIRLKDDGTARAITWGNKFVSRGATLPSTTVLGKYTYVGLVYNDVAAVWDCIATATEA